MKLKKINLLNNTHFFKKGTTLMKIKKIISMLLACAFVLSSAGIFASCGGKNEPAVKTVVDGVYRTSELKTSVKMNEISSVAYANGRLYVMGVNYNEEDYSRENLFYSFNIDGTDEKAIDTSWMRKDGGYMNNCIALPDGNLWIFYNEWYTENSDGSEDNGGGMEILPIYDKAVTETIKGDETDKTDSPETKENAETKEAAETTAKVSTKAIAANAVAATIAVETTSSEPYYPTYVEKYYFIKIDPRGKELLRVDLDMLKSEENSYVSVNNPICDKDGKLYFANNNRLCCMDSEGNLLFNNELDLSWINNLFIDGKTGDLVLSYYNETNHKLTYKIIDKSNGKMGKDFELSDQVPQNIYNFYSGEGYSFYYSDSNGIYGYDSTTGGTKMLLNYINSDIENNYGNVVIISESKFAKIDYDYQNGYRSYLSILDFIPPEEVTPKYILSLAVGDYSSYYVRQAVLDFNKKSEDYRIQIKDYSVYNTDEDYNLGTTRLNSDIVAGQIPDIILINQNMPFESYAAKGLFADLYQYMDNDPGINRADYLENIFRALEIDGKLYKISPRFNIMTTVAKTKFVGSSSGWTMEEFKEVISKMPEGMSVFSLDMTRSRFLETAISYMYDEFIDKNTGECYFNTDYFKGILEFASTLSKDDFDYSNVEDDYWEKYENRFKDDKILLEMTDLYGFEGFQSMKNYTFGEEEITMIGFPSGDGKGTAIYGEMSISISSKSKLVDGAWEFIKYFLTDDYQDSLSYGWPIKLSSIEKLADKVLNPEEYQEGDEYNGGIIGRPYIGESKITEAEVNMLLDIVKSTDKAARYSVDVLDIIKEEAMPFFDGKKTIDETADVIQRRIRTYVSEKR